MAIIKTAKYMASSTEAEQEDSDIFRYKGYKIEVVQDKDKEQEFTLEISWDPNKMTEYNG